MNKKIFEVLLDEIKALEPVVDKIENWLDNMPVKDGIYLQVKDINHFLSLWEPIYGLNERMVVYDRAIPCKELRKATEDFPYLTRIELLTYYMDKKNKAPDDEWIDAEIIVLNKNFKGACLIIREDMEVLTELLNAYL